MVTTTDKFQILPNYYKNKSEYKGYNIVNTNSRYDHFKQVHFTAGDTEQFNRFRDYSNNYEEIIPKTELSFNFPQLEWSKYKNIDVSAIDNTFKYMFYKFKKGIYVKIQNNELKVFLPFSNAEFTNEFHGKIKIDPSYENFEQMCGHIINRNKKQWYANDFLLRYEYPVKEGDAAVCELRDMLDELLKNRTVSDCDFFINRRDFPIIKENSTEPYETIFGENQPLLSHNYEKYAPIVSMVSKEGFTDIPFPTWDDWTYANPEKLFSTMKNVKDNFDIKWENKIPKAIFRGSSTGEGYDTETNLRMKLCSMEHEDLDVGITKWFCPMRFVKDKDYVTVLKPSLPLKPTMTIYEQSRYKYVINVDGNVSAFRLTNELKMGSVILLVDSPYKLWYHPLLKEYVHYVPVKRDLSDLIEKIEWCKNNDEKCKEIVKNALEFYQTHLTKEGIFNYLQELLYKIRQTSGKYYYNSVQYIDFMLEKEKEKVNEYFENMRTDDKIYFPNILEEDYGSCKVYEKIIANNLDKIKIIKTFLDAGVKYLEIGQIFGKKVIIKKNKIVNHNYKPLQERIHEGYVTIFGTNILRQEIPNFKYTFYSNSDFTVTEYIEGPTLNEWIMKSFNWDEYMKLFKMILLSVKVAQERIGFVHWDLYPWNIIIKKLDKTETFYYNVFPEQIFKITTDTIPVIIDFGKSHIVSEKQHHGFINMFHMNSFQDLYTFFTTSLNEILKYHNIFHIREPIFTFCKMFYERDFETIKELKDFITENKKFSNILLQFDKNPDKDILTFIQQKHMEKISKNMYCYKDHEILYSKVTKTPISLTTPKTFIDCFEKNIGLENSNYETLQTRYEKERLFVTKSIDINLYRMHNHSYFKQYNNLKNIPTIDLTLYYKFMNLKEIDILPEEKKEIIKMLKTTTNFKNLKNIANKYTYLDIIENIYKKDQELKIENSSF